MDPPELGRAERLGEEERPEGAELLVPDYEGANIASVVPAILKREDGSPEWLPEPARDADQVVLLVLDGLGFNQLQAHGEHAPALSSMAGGPITSVAPTTTATALTSIVSGARPNEHGIVGYRIAAGEEVLNVLRWSTPRGDARVVLPPKDYRVTPFLGQSPPVVSRAEFAGSGFTEVHLGGLSLTGYRVASSIRVEVGRQLQAGERFVYAYYDGIDRIAHETGLGEHYDAELSMADRIVSDLLSELPLGCCLVVTADHGHVEVRSEAIQLPEEVANDIEMFSGEGRFRWLHVREGRRPFVIERLLERYGEVAAVRTREELIEAGLFGGPLPPAIAERLGDVALIAAAPVAFSDPGDTGENRLIGRHGSLTADELYVPLVAWAP